MATYYIDPVSGNNANNGTSTETAWETIVYAERAAVAGSTIYLMDGQYDAANSWIDRNQVANRDPALYASARTEWAHALTFTPLDGHSPVIEKLFMEADTTTSEVNAYLIFDGLTFQYPDEGDTSPDSGDLKIFHSESDSCIKVLNCTVSAAYLGQNGSGQEWQTNCVQDCIAIGRANYGDWDDVTIDNCTLHTAGQCGVRIAGGRGETTIKNCHLYDVGHAPIKIEGTPSDWTYVHDNTMHTTIPVWVKGETETHHTSGIYLHGAYIDVRRNKIRAAGGSALLRIAQNTGDALGNHDINIVNNLFYDPQKSTSTMEGYNIGNNFKFNHNTVIGCNNTGTGRQFYGEAFHFTQCTGGLTGNTVEICNNIFGGYFSATNLPAGIACVGNVFYSYLDDPNWRDQDWMNSNLPGNLVYNDDETAIDGQSVFGMGGVARGTLFAGSTDFDTYHCTRGYHAWANDGAETFTHYHGVNLGDSYALVSGSPALEVANSDYTPETDILGNARGGSPDAGCYEYQAGGSQSKINNSLVSNKLTRSLLC